jgi:outer membrane lipoprotein LolB
MALQVQDAQQQSFSAGFELQGQPESGTLLVFNPLGSIMARLQWTRGGATAAARRSDHPVGLPA